MEYLSKIELYYTLNFSDEHKSFLLFDDEFKHSVKVMRNKVGDIIYATNGAGQIFKGMIKIIRKDNLECEIENTYNYKNELSHITFCISILKNPERQKFAIEKCTELGITDFIIFNSDYSLNKKINLDRMSNICLAAMKQSLRSYLPSVRFVNSSVDLSKEDGSRIIFDQSSSDKLYQFSFDREKKYNFIFGPEGGLSENEINKISPEYIFSLSVNRLRSETAIIKAASLINL